MAPYTTAIWLRRVLAGQPTGPEAVLVDGPYYKDRVSVFAQVSAPADVVMVGDSLTDGAEWHELLPRVRIANLGITGDTIFGIRQRLDSIKAAGAKTAMVMAGTLRFTCSIPQS